MSSTEEPPLPDGGVGTVAEGAGTRRVADDHGAYASIETGVIDETAADETDAGQTASPVEEGASPPPVVETDVFSDVQDVVQVFEYDCDALESFHVKTNCAFFATRAALGVVCVSTCWPLVTPLLAFDTLRLTPCFLRERVRWDVLSNHICVTRRGVVFLKDKRKADCGLACSDKGKVQMTIPYERISHAALVEPAGNTCFCVKNTLSSVLLTFDRPVVFGAQARGALKFTGLKDPRGFMDTVLRLKEVHNLQMQGMALRLAGTPVAVEARTVGIAADPLPAAVVASPAPAAMIRDCKDGGSLPVASANVV